MNNSNKLTGVVDVRNSRLLLEYDYQKLGREVSCAIIECPAILSFLMQRDLSVLTNENANASELHMKACLRMTCALIGLKDPFPSRTNVV